MKANIKKISELTGFSPRHRLQRAKQQARGEQGDSGEDPADSPGDWVLGRVARQLHQAGDVPRQRGHRQRLSLFLLPCRRGGGRGQELRVRHLGVQPVPARGGLRQPGGGAGQRPLQRPADLATELDSQEAARFQEALAPVVMLDNWYEDLNFNAVLIDNTDAASAAVRYLIEKGAPENWPT